MDKEDWKKKAMAFGKKALDVSKAVGKYSAEAGKEIAKEASVVGKSLSADLEKAAQNHSAKSADKKRLEARDGVWYSQKILPEAFEDVESQLAKPLGRQRFNVRADSATCVIQGQSSWNEDIPGFPNSYHEINLTLQFEATPEGTTVTYSWLVDDWPKGLQTIQLLRTINSWVEFALTSPSAFLAAEQTQS